MPARCGEPQSQTVSSEALIWEHVNLVLMIVVLVQILSSLRMFLALPVAALTNYGVDSLREQG